MIIEIFSILTILSLCFIVLGYFKDIPFLGMLGFISMFLLSFPLINNDLQYKIGSNVTDVSSTQSSISNVYTSYNGSSTIGKYMAIIFGILFLLSIIKETGVYDSWRESYEENHY